jgi:SAM-dependent methyltransferase
VTSDIFEGQAGDADLLAAIYDLEHDDFGEDIGFYRRLIRRGRGPLLDLGCGSGRLFRAFLDGGATSVRGVDGSPSLIRRAERRIATDAVLAAAAEAGRIQLTVGDVRRPPTGRWRWITAVGVLPHLEGPEAAVRMLAAAGERLQPTGRLVLDDIGPGGLPDRDLPLSMDWERALEGRMVTRRSQLSRRDGPDGLRVDYLTVTDAVRPDGTIARLPARFRLWYPSKSVLEGLLDEAGLAVELTYGSHDLEPLTAESDRRIVIAMRGHERRSRRTTRLAPGRCER